MTGTAAVAHEAERPAERPVANDELADQLLPRAEERGEHGSGRAVTTASSRL